MPDSPLETYDRLLLALDQLLQQAQRVGDAGVREWASLAMLDAIDIAKELGAWARVGLAAAAFVGVLAAVWWHSGETRAGRSRPWSRRCWR